MFLIAAKIFFNGVKIMKMDIIDLKIVLSISETKSLTETAKKINLTTPAISYRLKNIEDSFGIVLFDRDHKGMIITQAGMDFIQYAKNVLKSTNQLIHHLNRRKESERGLIRLLANSSTLHAVTEKMALYLHHYPNINIDVEEKLSEQIVWDVLDNVADVGLIAGDIDIRGLEQANFGVDELVFIVSKEHMLAKHSSVRFREAIHYDMVAAGKKSSNFLFIENLAKKYNSSLRVRVHSQNFYSMISCVKQNVGIAMVPLSAITNEIIDNVVVVKIDEKWSSRDQRIIYKKRSLDTSFISTFIDDLKQ